MASCPKITVMVLAWILLCTKQVVALSASEQQEDPIAETEHAQPDTGLDPTILNSRIALTNEYKNQEMGAIKNTTTLNLAYAFGNPARYDWSAQLDLPLVYYDAGRRPELKAAPGSATSKFASVMCFAAKEFFGLRSASRPNSIRQADHRGVTESFGFRQ